MKSGFKNIVLKVLKISGISIGVILLALFLIPIAFPGQIAEKVKDFANKKLEGELNFKEANLSFFNHFPSLTVTLNDFSLKGSAPYKNETLIKSDEVAFGINVMSLIFDNSIKIDKIFVSNAEMNVLVNEKGEANYNVYISDKNAPKDSSGTSLRLEKIAIENSHLVYNDKSAKILIDAKGFNYVGNGGLDKAIFDLYTEAKIDSFDFSFAGEEYLKNKKIDADLITQINTNSLAFVFRQNNLIVNKLPVEFLGKLDFLKNGYDIDFSAKSDDSNLNDLFTALPPQYVEWLEKTKVKGRTDLMLTFKGRYSAATNSKPDLAFAMNIRKGYISYKESPFPTSNIEMKFKTKLPSLNTDSLIVDLDTLFFNVDKDFLGARIHSKGMKNIALSADVKSKLDLSKLNRAIGLQNLDMKGLFSAKIKAKGVYNASRHLFPKADGFVNLENGWLKTSYYPNPIEHIQFKGKIKNTTGLYKDLNVSLTPASFSFEGNPIYVQAALSDFDNIHYDIKAKGNLDVGKIYKVFAQKGLSVNGFIKADVAFKGTQSDAMSGRYDRLDNKGTLLVQNIVTVSKYFPKPFLIKEGSFTFDRDKMWFKTFMANYGQSDFAMDGYLQNAINFVLAEKGTLKGNFSVHSDFINVDEFMSGTNEGQVPPSGAKQAKPATGEGVVLLPVNTALSLAANVKKVSFEGLDLNNLAGNLALEEGKLKLKNTSFNLIDSRLMIDGAYDDINTGKANFDLRFLAKDFNVKKAYNEIRLFKELVSAAENAEGIISVDYKLKGVLDGAMQPIMPSLQGNGVISVRKVKMKGFRLLGAVSKKTGSDGINDPDLSAFDIKSSIRNNVITVEETKVKVALFRLKFNGETNFDGQLNLRMRLGLPPLGIIGIPVVITGTNDKPVVKIFSKTGKEVEKTEFTEDKSVSAPPATTEPKAEESPKKP
ncbi:AsmA family protein [Flavobacterium humi]|uniref:AsmA family protein n=1 Tax=Flavobacterium humi TaxID=2562683 RepID=A0A4Z0L6Y2_9FLAO|nr:AsmA family protein [Flavobacterium humi]TGD57326.1 AsmA family protein [Flavobacterium humi]